MFIQLFINTLIIGSGYGLMAMAFRLLYSVTPFLNISLGVIPVVGAFAAYFLSLTVGLPDLVSVICALILSAVLNWLFEKSFFHPLRRKGASATVLLIASLGLYIVFEAGMKLVVGKQCQTLGELNLSGGYGVWFAEISVAQFALILTNAVVFKGLESFLTKTLMGKQIRAVNDSRTLSGIIGINRGRIILITSVIAGLVLGLAGILIAYNTCIWPETGFSLLFKGIIGAVIGGITTLKGAFLGSFFLAFVENVGVVLFSEEWRDAIAFILFITFLYFRPKGIFQKKVRH